MVGVRKAYKGFGIFFRVLGPPPPPALELILEHFTVRHIKSSSKTFFWIIVSRSIPICRVFVLMPLLLVESSRMKPRAQYQGPYSLYQALNLNPKPETLRAQYQGPGMDSTTKKCCLIVEFGTESPCKDILFRTSNPIKILNLAPKGEATSDFLDWTPDIHGIWVVLPLPC